MTFGLQVLNSVILVISKKERTAITLSEYDKRDIPEKSPDTREIKPLFIRKILNTEKATIIVHI